MRLLPPPAAHLLRWLALACAAFAPLMLAPARALQPQTPTPAAYPLFGVVAAAPAMNVRACPGRDCEVIYSVPKGESVRVTGPARDGWLPVSRDGTPGWAFPLYVQIGGAPAPWFQRGEPGCKRVSFLFNLGVGFTTRTEVLDWMAANGVPAMMFPMGWWAEADPASLQRMRDLGFPIA
ncbi:MAG: SH3 domain-containing protein, partial [Chloroflexota bacterium]